MKNDENVLNGLNDYFWSLQQSSAAVHSVWIYASAI